MQDSGTLARRGQRPATPCQDRPDVRPLPAPGSRLPVTPAAAELAALFPEGQVTPIELGGMSSVLRRICPGEITAGIEVGRMYRLDASELGLTAGQREMLKAGPGDRACARAGCLIDDAAGRPAAAVTAIVLIRRIPWECLRTLRLTPAGYSRPGRTPVPLGTALRQRNVYRRQQVTLLTPGHTDAAGRAQVLYSQALLETDRPIALLTEQVYGEFLERYPPPWPGVPGAVRSPGLTFARVRPRNQAPAGIPAGIA